MKPHIKAKWFTCEKRPELMSLGRLVGRVTVKPIEPEPSSQESVAAPKPAAENEWPEPSWTDVSLTSEILESGS